MAGFVSWLVIALPILPGQEAAFSVRDEVRVRNLLKSGPELNWDELTKSRGLSAAALPFYTRILDDPKEEPSVVARTLLVLTKVKADRSPVLERAVTKLADSDGDIRRNATRLLGQIGGTRDTAPIIALLSDDDVSVGMAAAEAIQAIGGPRDLVALDAWLRVSPNKQHTPEYRKQYEKLRDHVEKARDGLKTRLDKEKAQRPKLP